MSNKVDFYQSSQSGLCLPAGRVSVFLEDGLCEWLEVKEINRSGWPEFDSARLVVNSALCPGEDFARTEEIENNLGMGKAISIRQFYNGLYPDVGVFSLPLFIGYIERVEKRCDSDGELLEVIARDFSARFERIRVYGQYVSDVDGSVVFLPGLDTIFNKDGRANASEEFIRYNGLQSRLFSSNEGSWTYWSYAEVLDYLLGQYLSGVRLIRPEAEQLEVLTEGQKVRDLDLTDLTLLESIHRCCRECGLDFKFSALPVDAAPFEAIEFFRRGSGRSVELNCQQQGQQLSISNTDVSSFESGRDFCPVTHKYIGQGDFKVFEGTFELVKAWDASLEDTDYDKFSPSTNPNFVQVKDVYRKWSLNEAGDYTGASFNLGEAFDFSGVFGSGNFVHRRRRFWPALSRTKSGESIGYFLEVSYDGQNWWQYMYAFDNLLDECGIWLSCDLLDADTWVAALKGVLRFRITVSVVSDQRVTCSVADGPVDSTVEVVEFPIAVPRRFKYRKVTGESIFSQAGDSDSLGEADEVDDTEQLCEFVRKLAVGWSPPFEKIKVKTLCLAYDYRVGDRIKVSPDSCDLFGVKSDNAVVAWIERVRMDFEKQRTELSISRGKKVIL